ncbi:cyclic nucleotide-binding domain-containing protein, partial [Modestobacter roseus]
MTSTTPRIDVEELRSLFLFESLDDDVLAWLAARAEVRVFDADAVVFAEDEPAEALFVLLEGGLLLSKHATG